MSWQELQLVCPREQADAVAGVLEAAGALAVTLTDAQDRPIFEPEPGRTPLWNLTKVTGLYDAGHDLRPAIEALKASLGEAMPGYEIKPLADQDWVRAGQQGFSARRFGERLWVVPSWCDVPPEAEVRVEIDPGLAFGTGSHPTTALCLQWLDATVTADCRVCDYGCGSGVLAIAAAVLGAREVYANDIDRQALQATRDNAKANQVAGRVQTALAAEAVAGQFDVVVANILAGPLVDLAERISALVAPGGKLALSGLLVEQKQQVLDAYLAQSGMSASGESHLDGWARLDLAKAAH